MGNVFVHSPEDLILYKLVTFSLSEQSKHIRDITAILRAQQNLLDREYIGNWTDRLGLTTLWNELVEDVGGG